MVERITKRGLMLSISLLVAKRSTCKRLQVGSIITDDDFSNIYSMGYNGGYAGDSNETCTGEPGKCGCLHSEINALIKKTGGDVMFVTSSPCIMCAKAIINAGIKKVYYHELYRDDAGIVILRDAGVKVIHISTK